jgi:O-antigen/teichoic acid export membrane protein
MVNTPQPYAGDTKGSPVIACIIGTIISCILAAGIIVAHIPEPAPLWGSIMWVSIAAVLTVTTIVLILRKRPFARKLFFTVAKWVFLYILVLTGMGEYVIVFDGTRGETLVVITVILLLFLVNIPMLWGFSVARHERTSSLPLR